MARKLSVLDNVRIASPCPESWAGMSGDERVRHCGRCQLNVFNLSEMTRSEAEALILERQGQLCVRYFQRDDGTILTADCRPGASIARRRLARVLGGIAAAFAFVAGGLHALGRTEPEREKLRLWYMRPFDQMITWMSPPSPRILLGRVARPSLLRVK